MPEFSIDRRFEITFTNGDTEKTVSSTNAEDTDEAYAQARDQLVAEQSISIAEFERSWHVDQRHQYVSFSDPPWDGGDIQSDLESLTGVSNARYVDPMNGSYGPPKYVLDVSSTSSFRDVEDNVRDYYDGLMTERQGNKVVVVVSAVRRSS